MNAKEKAFLKQAADRAVNLRKMTLRFALTEGYVYSGCYVLPGPVDFRSKTNNATIGALVDDGFLKWTPSKMSSLNTQDSEMTATLTEKGDKVAREEFEKDRGYKWEK